jgi:hypothetical protein
MLVKEIQYKRNIPILTTVSILFDHIYPSHKELYCRVRFMVFNASFNNISVISWWSVLLVEETWVPRGNHRLVTSHWQTWSHIVVLSTPVTVLYLALHVQMYKKCIQSIVCSYMSDIRSSVASLVTCTLSYLYLHVNIVITLYVHVHTCLTIDPIVAFVACTNIAVHLVSTIASILTGRLYAIVYILNNIINLYFNILYYIYWPWEDYSFSLKR